MVRRRLHLLGYRRLRWHTILFSPQRRPVRAVRVIRGLSRQGAIHVPSKRMPIAYIELLAALVDLSLFSASYLNKLIKVNTDNTRRRLVTQRSLLTGDWF